MLNLVNNALKFSQRGKIMVIVEPKLQSPTAICLQFSVQDSGIGIHSEQIPLLFKPFSQADSSTTRKYGGTGLGLAICKQLVEKMDGKIWVESEVDKGSQFFFTANFGVCEYDVSVKALLKTISMTTCLTGRKVLLVEDDALSRELAIELLANLGIQVEVAENGKQAVQKVTTKAFDLVLMDIQMPEMDGLTATRLIRADDRLKDLPIIALTARAMSSDEEKSRQAGMNDYLTKPINPEKLATTLTFWIKAMPHSATVIQQNAQPDTERKFPAELPPFNLSAALQRVRGNTQLLRKLILMFYHDYVDIPKKLPQLILDGQYQEAERLVHMLKGAAMQLEMEELSGLAAAVEQAISERKPAKIKLFSQALESVLTPAIQAAASLLPFEK